MRSGQKNAQRAEKNAQRAENSGQKTIIFCPLCSGRKQQFLVPQNNTRVYRKQLFYY